MKFLMFILLCNFSYSYSVVINVPTKMSTNEGVSFVKSLVESNSQDHIFTFKSKLKVSKNFHILWAMGKKDTPSTRDEYMKFWGIINKAPMDGFQVILNTRAVAEDMQNAIEDIDTAVILISTHGNDEGFYDYDDEKVPYSVFSKASPNLYQVILSACYSTLALPHYHVPARIKVYSWKGTTDIYDLMALLKSPEWDITNGVE